MSRVIGNEINQQKNTGTSVAINNGTINQTTNHYLMDKIIEALAAAQRDVSIVIDALDQLPTDDRDYLQKGLEELHISLQHKDNCLRVAISSRNTPSHHDLEGYKLFDIRVHPDYNADGIRNYLERTLDNSFFRENEDLKTSSVKKLLLMDTFPNEGSSAG
ncbi:hypothetical protein J3F84DRAFT_344010 [Trichoderma pleuroticola]